MARVVFLVEEKSMQVLLNGLLPRLFPTLAFQCVVHEGKSDLEKSIPRKLKAWREPQVRFVILRDSDSGDCQVIKKKLLELCRQGGREAIVRIVCRELEAWYLGDAEALATAYGDQTLLGIGNRERFRDPDSVVGAAQAVLGLIPSFQKVSGARLMAQHLRGEGNRSHSFRVFLTTVSTLCAA